MNNANLITLAQTGSNDGEDSNLFYVPKRVKTDDEGNQVVKEARSRMMDKWYKRVLDNADFLSLNYNQYRLDWWEMYNMYCGQYDMEKYKYVWGTWGAAKPMTFGQYPLISKMIDAIVGEYLTSNINYTVYKVNNSATNDMLDKQAELIALQLMKMRWGRVEQSTGVPLSDIDQRADQVPDDVKKYMKYDFRDLLDQAMKYGIDYTIMRHDQISEFALMLYDLCIGGSCWGRVVERDGDAFIERICPANVLADEGNPGNIYRALDNENLPFTFIEEYLPLTEVLYRYEPYMKQGDAQKLKDSVTAVLSQSSIYARDGITFAKKDNGTIWVRVVYGQWKARNEKPVPTGVDPITGEIKYEGDSILDVYEGAKIYYDIYAKCRRKPNILRRFGNYKNAQLDFFGISTKLSLMSKGCRLQMLYSIAYSCLEFSLVQAGGKAITIYQDEIPNKNDGTPYTLAEVVNMLKSTGINLKQRKEGIFPGGHPDSNREIDYGISSTVGNIIVLLQSIERAAQTMTGIAGARIGAAPASATNGVTEQNFQSSSNATQPIFQCHSYVTTAALQRVSDLLRLIWPANTTRSFVLGDMGFQTLKWPSDIANCDYGLFVRNSAKDSQDKKFYLDVMQQTLSIDPTFIKEIVQIYNSSSSVEAQKIVEGAIDEIRAITQQKMQMEAQQSNANAQIQQGKTQAEITGKQIQAQGHVQGTQVSARAHVAGKLIDKSSKIASAELARRAGNQRMGIQADAQIQQQNNAALLEAIQQSLAPNNSPDSVNVGQPQQEQSPQQNQGQ